jgi:hypothetical protein
MPQQGGEIPNNVAYLNANTTSQFPPAPTEMYGMPGDALLNQGFDNGMADIGQASSMAPPSINVEFAPPSRVPSFGPSKPTTDLDSLSPPAMRSFQLLQPDFYLHHIC